jgi:hypothetical protein
MGRATVQMDERDTIRMPLLTLTKCSALINIILLPIKAEVLAKMQMKNFAQAA